MSKEFFLTGLGDKHDIKEIRKTMLKPDKAKITSAEKKLKKIENEKIAWQLVNRRIIALNTIAKQIISLDGPFNQMLGKSSNEDILTLSTQYGSKKENHKIDIYKIAGRDVFFSDNFNKNTARIPEGDYVFFIGDKEIKIVSNGNLNALVNDINRAGKGFLSAKIIEIDNNGNSRLILKSLKEGEENKLIMKYKALEFAKNFGILSKFKTNFNPLFLEITKNQKSDKNNISFSYDSGNLILNPLSEVSIYIPEDIKITDKTRIKFEIKYKDLDFLNSKNKIVFNPGEAVFKDAKVESEKSIIEFESDIKDDLKEEEYVKVNMIKLFGNNESTETEPINISNNFEKVELEVGSVIDLERIVVENNTNNKVFTIRNVEFYDPRSRDGYLPINAKSFAENAEAKFDGIDIKRNSNTIKDLIPNVTLNFKRPSNETIELKIEPDYESMIKLFYNFIFAYNETLAAINILTSMNDKNNDDYYSNSNYNSHEDYENGEDSKKSYRKSNVIEELTYLTKEEKEESYKVLGALSSEFLLKSIKSQLEGIMFRSYKTGYPNFSIINQIGVYTNSAFSGTGLSRYLQIDENKFNEIIKNNTTSIKELFALDFNGDKVYDDGIAKRFVDYLSPLVNFGGPINNKLKGFEDKIFSQINFIEDYKKKYNDKAVKIDNDLKKLDFTIKNMKEQEKILRSLNMDN